MTVRSFETLGSCQLVAKRTKSRTDRTQAQAKRIKRDRLKAKRFKRCKGK